MCAPCSKKLHQVRDTRPSMILLVTHDFYKNIVFTFTGRRTNFLELRGTDIGGGRTHNPDRRAIKAKRRQRNNYVHAEERIIFKLSRTHTLKHTGLRKFFC